jgi:hypothetical protein
VNKNLPAATANLGTTQALNLVVSGYNQVPSAKSVTTTASGTTVNLRYTGDVTLIDASAGNAKAVLPASSFALGAIKIAKIDSSGHTVTIIGHGVDAVTGNVVITSQYGSVTAHPVYGGWIVL